MQDIIPPRKSIRDIPLPESRRKNEEEIERVIHKERQEIPPYDGLDDYPPPRPVGDKGPRKILWVVAAALILGVVFSLMVLYSKADLAIVTKNQAVPVSLSATSTKDGVEGTIPYSIVTLEKEAKVELNGTVSTKQVEKKASGTITIYNNYSSDSQTLIATTRFQTKDGLVYRIDKAITIPGKTTQNSQSVPGSADAMVFADQTGPKYNIGKTDFSVPGFKGTDKEITFYAKSKTDMTGGYVGNETSVSDEEMNTKRTDLQNSIQKELVAQVKMEAPETFAFFPSALVINFTSNVESQSGKTVLTGKGVALAPIFNKKLLADQINEASGTNYSVFEGWENLQAEITNTAGLASGDFPNLLLNLQGSLNVGQEINIGELQRALAGTKKSDLSNILSTYPSVLSANAKIQPFWKSYFPNDAQRISITLTKEK